MYLEKLYSKAFVVVRHRLRTESSALADELRMKTAVAALSDPDDDRNMFAATMEWPTDDDPRSQVILRANAPDERLKDGQGYLGARFLYSERVHSACIHTELQICYGLGSVGLLEPKDSSITETLEGATGNKTEPLQSAVAPESAAIILARFGIGKTR